MHNKNLLQKLMLLSVTVFLFAAAKALPKVFVTTSITTNTTWTNDNIYVLSGYIYVKNNATLTIEPGTVIYGNDPGLFSKGALIVSRGAQIQAVGTPCRPIVFTSGNTGRNRKRGDWGGLILLGSAQINNPGDTAHIEGISPVPETLYGGGANPDNNDNSGTLRYVRIEYAGVALSPNNEINGLTLGGVGAGTTIDHVQVSYSNDDSYEWFGGNVNAKYLVAFKGIDDDFDTDNGYSGKVQFGISLRDPAVADVSKSHGFESDNDASGSANLPQTRAVFSNMTIDAGNNTTSNALYEAGIYIRRNSHLNIYNSVVLGWPTGILIDGTASQNNVLNDTLVEDNVIGGTAGVGTLSPTGNTSVIDLLTNNAGNRFYSGNGQIQLVKPFLLTNPDFRPTNTSPAKTGGNFTHPGLQNAFFTPTTYVGALSTRKPDDWTNEAWINWRPEKTDYTNGAFGTGCQGFAELKDEPVNTASTVATADVQISPNPNRGVFNVTLKGFAASTVNIKIAALNSGKVYYAGKAANNSITKLSINVPAGNYAIEFNDGKNIVSKKVSILY